MPVSVNCVIDPRPLAVARSRRSARTPMNRNTKTRTQLLSPSGDRRDLTASKRSACRDSSASPAAGGGCDVTGRPAKRSKRTTTGEVETQRIEVSTVIKLLDNAFIINCPYSSISTTFYMIQTPPRSFVKHYLILQAPSPPPLPPASFDAADLSALESKLSRLEEDEGSGPPSGEIEPTASAVAQQETRTPFSSQIGPQVRDRDFILSPYQTFGKMISSSPKTSSGSSSAKKKELLLAAFFFRVFPVNLGHLYLSAPGGSEEGS